MIIKCVVTRLSDGSDIHAKTSMNLTTPIEKNKFHRVRCSHDGHY